jgi:hypothetical protein
LKKKLLVFIYIFIAMLSVQLKAAGEGTALISPLTAAPNSPGNTMTIIFNANGTAWTNGQLRVTIPAGWSAPSVTSTDDGYYTLSVSGGTLGVDTVSLQEITIPVTSLNSDGTITLIYGASTQGAASQASTGAAIFTVETDPVGSAVTPIATQPEVQVMDATATLTVTETETETITETNTPSVTETGTETITETQTETVTDTVTGTVTQTVTETETETSTASVTETVTETATETSTSSVTETFTETATETSTSSVTETVTETATQTSTASVTETVTETETETETVTETSTASVTETGTETITETQTESVTTTVTQTATQTITETATEEILTATNTQTITETSTQTVTETSTLSITETGTETITETQTESVTTTVTQTATQTTTETATEEIFTMTNTQTNTETSTQTVTETSTASVTQTGTETITETQTETVTETVTETETQTITETATEEIFTVTNTQTTTETATETVTETNTSSITETATKTITETNTESVTTTVTETATQTVTETSTLEILTATNTQTNTETATQTVTETNTPSVTETVTETATQTVTETPTLEILTATNTQTNTETSTQTSTQTVTETSTPSVTETGTQTITETQTQSVTVTVTETATQTVTETPTLEILTATNTQTNTETSTQTVTETSTPSVTETGTQTITETQTQSATTTVTQTVTETVTIIMDTETITQTSTGTVTETVSATITETSTITVTATIVLTPEGEGSALISPLTVAAGTSGNTMIITYTAGATSWTNGTLRITIPTGWSAPSLTSGQPGYYTVSVSGGTFAGTSRSGQIITIYCSALNSVTGQVTVTYGAGIPGAVSQVSEGTAVFTVQSSYSGAVTYPISVQPQVNVIPATATATITLTSTSTPTITVTSTVTGTHTATMTVTQTNTPAIGEGSALVSPSTVMAGGTGNTMLIEYTAGTTNWASSPGYGTLKIFIPAGWTLPGDNPSVNGYTTWSVQSGSVTGYLILGNEIRLFVQGLQAGNKVYITYGNKASNSGVTAQPGTGTAEFAIHSQPSGTNTNPIAFPPSVIVALATATITPTVTMTYTSTPDSTPVTASGISAVLNGENISLQWSTAANVDYYKVYNATGAAGKLYSISSGWTVIATVIPTPGTSGYVFSDNNDYSFYAVSAVNGAGESAPANAGGKVNVSFDYAAGYTNTYRMSMPYSTAYIKALDIVAAVEGNTYTANKIDMVATWNPYTQSFVPFSNKFGTWSLGTNFNVDAGTASSNAIYMHAVSAFTWTQVFNEVSASLIFHHNSVIANANKRMLPYSANYGKASDIVRDIEGGTGAGTNQKINKIAKWNAASQSYIVFAYSAGLAQWGLGTDFNILPGEAVNIYASGNSASFTWTPKLALTPVP